MKVTRTRRNALELSSPILKCKAGKLCKICAFTTLDDVAANFFQGWNSGSGMTPSLVFQLKPWKLSVAFPPGGAVLSTTLLFRNGVAFCVNPELVACVVLMHGPLPSFVFCPMQQAKPCWIFFELLSMEENGRPFCCNPLSFCFAKLMAPFRGNKLGPSQFSEIPQSLLDMLAFLDRVPWPVIPRTDVEEPWILFTDASACFPQRPWWRLALPRQLSSRCLISAILLS